MRACRPSPAPHAALTLIATPLPTLGAEGFVKRATGKKWDVANAEIHTALNFFFGAVRNNMERSDVTSAEAFRQVLELYSIELQYGRGIEAYTDTITLGGMEREVDILRIGRVALVYQSTDGAETGAWNKEAKMWEELSAGDYAAAVRKGVRIAKKQATIELLNMPVSAPEAN